MIEEKKYEKSIQGIECKYYQIMLRYDVESSKTIES